MPDTENSTPFRDIVQNRAPSKFFAKEMIFDCVRGHVDATRASAIEKIIEDNEDLKHQRNLVKIAEKYCSLLSQIQINEKSMAEINGSVNLVDKVRGNLVPRTWPIPLKWGVEAFIVSALVASATLALFWSNIETFLPQRQEMVLAHEKMSIERDTNTTITDQGEIAEVHKTLARETPAVETPAVETPTVENPAPPPPPVAAPKPPPPPKVEAPKVEPEILPVVEEKPDPVVPTKAETPAVAKPTPPPAPKVKGYVYKQYMSLKNLEVLAPELTAKIVELGGEKAGEVELGWKKPNGRYYHFVLPKENREALVELLKSYGPLTEVKDPHARVMPESEERYILWIEGN